ncbi:MAG: hypothetical protein FWD37_03895 [Methanomassiliicoccaceae archaeon]|nr:hypothetical protein [Methanomassiliicoccaceae archaeon]
MVSDTAKKNDTMKKNLPSVLAMFSAIAFASVVFMTDLKLALGSVPVLLAIPLFGYLLVREKKEVLKAERIMNEAPAAIGMMRLMIDRNRSLDSAVREIAENGPKNIAKMFGKIIWDVDTKASADIRDSLNSMISSLPDALAAFRRSLYLIISASGSKDVNERMRMTKDANDIILTGLKDMGEAYSSKLNAPCMLIFGLGVMIPMILVSVIPMLSIGGQFSSAALDPMVIAAVTLLVIPAIVAMVIMTISNGNPFYVRSDEKITVICLMPVAISVPILAVMFSLTEDIALSMAAAAIASGCSLFTVLYPKMTAERKRVKISSSIGDVLFDLGNRLLSGENFETALISSFKEKKNCSELASTLERCISISRGETDKAIRSAMDPYSKKMADLYCDVYTSSLKDLRDAGRLAVSMGHQLQDQNAAVSSIQNKLRSMLDMMTGTSSIFAPLILGISVSMLAPFTDLAGGTQMSFTAPILMAYLIELAALISVLTTQLKCKGGILTSLYSFSMMMPLALVVFILTSSISL